MKLSAKLQDVLLHEWGAAEWLEIVGDKEPCYRIQDYVDALHDVAIDFTLESTMRLWARPSWLYSEQGLSSWDYFLHHNAFSDKFYQAMGNAILHNGHEKKMLQSLHGLSILVSLCINEPRSLPKLTASQIDTVIRHLIQFAVSRSIHMPLYLWDKEGQTRLIKEMISSHRVFKGFYPLFLSESIENDIFCLSKEIIPENPSEYYEVLSLMVDSKFPKREQVEIWIQQIQSTIKETEVVLHL